MLYLLQLLMLVFCTLGSAAAGDTALTMDSRSVGGCMAAVCYPSLNTSSINILTSLWCINLKVYFDHLKEPIVTGVGGTSQLNS